MLPWRQTNDKRQTESENRASQPFDKGLLTFAIIHLETNYKENIHSKQLTIIPSKRLLIFLKN